MPFTCCVIVEWLRSGGRGQPGGGAVWVVSQVFDVAYEVPLLIVGLGWAPVESKCPVCYQALLPRVSVHRHAPATKTSIKVTLATVLVDCRNDWA